MIHVQADLFNPPPVASGIGIQPWKPTVLTHEQWPPDYAGVYAWRIKTLNRLRSDPQMLADALAYYERHPVEFICHWMDTYNPRKRHGKWMPFVLFARQQEYVEFLQELDRDQENGMVEKCRDFGMTWLSCAYSAWAMRFRPDDSTGWGSRKEELVDKLGDPDSIFEKINLLIERLPDIFKPHDWKRSFMKVVNRDNGATITGESGDNIGRGGRKTRYFKDEAQPLTSMIVTPFGLQPMRRMKVGTIVCGPDGNWRFVVGINDCGNHPVYRVTFSDGTSVECSVNHLWKVQHNRTKQWSVESLSAIIDNYRYEAPGGQIQYRYRVPTTEPVRFAGCGNYPLDPYLVGALLGDGSVGSVPTHSPKITTVDQEIVDQFVRLLPEGCTITQEKGRPTWRLGDVRGRQGWKYKSRARQAVVAAGIAGMTSENKTIPEMYKYGSIEDRWSLLQGLMDTDGSAANGGSASFHTCSALLACDVADVVSSLGGTATCNVKKDPRGFKDQYVLHIATDDNPRLFRLSRKIAAIKSRKHPTGRNITNIEFIGMQPVRCISVDAPDGLYLTDNYTVTHNSAHYERPELIEAALGDNTDVQIDISSVNGLGNVFHRRREAGVVWEPGVTIEPGLTRVFIADWRDHPEKTQEWYDRRKAKAEREGMQHVFAQEVDHNYSAAIQNTIIAYEWIEACVDAHLEIPCMVHQPSDEWMAGLDLKDEGGDKHALVARQGIVLRHAEEWGDDDPGEAARRTIRTLKSWGRRGVPIQYDCIAIGATVKSEYNRLVESGELDPADYPMVPWHAGAAIQEPFARVIKGDDESPTNRDFFMNMKAQAWWSMRTRCYKTWRARKFGDVYALDELISIDGSMPRGMLEQLKKELAQATRAKTTGLKLVIEKKPTGTRSPNLADAAVQCYFPAANRGGQAILGSYGA